MCYAVPRTTVVLHVVRGFTFHFFTIFAKGKAMAHMHFIFSGKPSAALGFLNKNLEIRKNRVNTHTHRARASIYFKSFNPQRFSGSFPAAFSPPCEGESYNAYRISAMRQRAGGDFHISPEPCHVRQCCARRFPGLFVSNKEQINQI